MRKLCSGAAHGFTNDPKEMSDFYKLRAVGHCIGFRRLARPRQHTGILPMYHNAMRLY
jgi:hypothetical protein